MLTGGTAGCVVGNEFLWDHHRSNASNKPWVMLLLFRGKGVAVNMQWKKF